MQYGGDGTAVCMIKIDSQLSCTGIVGGRGYGSRLRTQRDLLGTGMRDDADMCAERRSWRQAAAYSDHRAKSQITPNLFTS